MLGHAGGIDEIALALTPVLLFLAYTTLRGRSAREAARRPPTGPCEYCGTMLDGTMRRCPTCGFRARPLAGSSVAAAGATGPHGVSRLGTPGPAGARLRTPSHGDRPDDPQEGDHPEHTEHDREDRRGSR